MTKFLLKIAVFTLLLTGCSGKSTYEKAIADFLQTDKKGTWTDLQFKVIEMGEPVDITVKDSINILTEKFEDKKAKELDFYNRRIADNKARMEKERFNTMKKFYQSLIDKSQIMVDSLTKMTVKLPNMYKNTDTTTVLAKEITCKFSIVNPMLNNAKQEMTETFILNAKGDKCYRRLVRKNNP